MLEVPSQPRALTPPAPRSWALPLSLPSPGPLPFPGPWRSRSSVASSGMLSPGPLRPHPHDHPRTGRAHSRPSAGICEEMGSAEQTWEAAPEGPELVCVGRLPQSAPCGRADAAEKEPRESPPPRSTREPSPRSEEPHEVALPLARLPASQPRLAGVVSRWGSEAAPRHSPGIFKQTDPCVTSEGVGPASLGYGLSFLVLGGPSAPSRTPVGPEFL